MGWRPEAVNPEHTFKWELVKEFGPSPDHIFFQDSIRGVGSIAHEGRALIRPDAVLSPPPFNSPSTEVGPHGFPVELHTTAELEGVAEIVTSGRWIDGVPVVVGLLVKYSSGRVESVGQIRLDTMGRSLAVRPFDKIWIGFFPGHVAIGGFEVSRKQPEPRGHLAWASITFEGVLDWWFYLNNHRIYQNGVRCLPGYRA